MGLREDLDAEIDNGKFLELLLSALYGEGWENLTIYEAREWHKKHFTE